MRTTLAFLWCLFLLAPACLADGWDPIPASVWAMKADPAKGIQDAVVLESRTSFMRTHVDYLYRVRIFTEAGRAAAELGAFSEDCYAFSGRTIYPDGKVVTFDKKQDFQTKKEQFGDDTVKRTVVIPPGITSDCVMELRWKESTDGEQDPLPARCGNSSDWIFGHDFFTLVQTYEVPATMPYGCLCAPSHSFVPVLTTKSGMRVFTLKDIPAFDHSPFSLRISVDRPHIYIYMVPQILRTRSANPPEFWGSVARMIQDWFRNDLMMGDTFKDWADDLIAHCQSRTPQAKAMELQAMIASKIRFLSQQTAEEAAKRSKKLDIPKYYDLNLMVKQGEGVSLGIQALTFQVLERAGLHPKVAMVANRSHGIIRYKVMNMWQWDCLQILVEEKDRPSLWLDPGERYTFPGFIDEDYQGVNGLIFDITGKTDPVQVQIPVRGPEHNRKTFTYTLNLSEEEDAFKLKAELFGQPAIDELAGGQELDAEARNKRLKERFQKAMKDTTISTAEVADALARGSVTWTVAGSRENTPGRKRTVLPFPGMASPVTIPASMPANHPLPIVLPHLRTVTATSTFLLPKGYHLGPQTAMAESNGFGTVNWQVSSRPQGDATEAVVTYQVTLETMLTGSENYGLLKEFLTWVETANGRTVELEK